MHVTPTCGIYVRRDPPPMHTPGCGIGTPAVETAPGERQHPHTAMSCVMWSNAGLGSTPMRCRACTACRRSSSRGACNTVALLLGPAQLGAAAQLAAGSGGGGGFAGGGGGDRGWAVPAAAGGVPPCSSSDARVIARADGVKGAAAGCTAAQDTHLAQAGAHGPLSTRAPPRQQL